MTTLGFGRSGIRAFGKLPLAGDFLSFGSLRGVAEEWKEWMSRAFADEATTSSRGLTTKEYRFWFRGEREGMLRTPVAGYLKDSADRLGRRFPFAWFVGAANGGRGGEGALKAGIAAWTGLEPFFHKLPSLESADALYQALGSHRAEEEKPRAHPLDATLQQVADALSAREPKAFAALVGRIQRILHLPPADGATARLALKIPLDDSYSVEGQANLWLRILDGRPGGSRAGAPNLFLPVGRQSGEALFVFWRELVPEDALRLFSDATSSAGFFDLCDVREKAAASEDVEAGEQVLARAELASQASSLGPSAFWP